jgi:hypothetical protein
MNSRPQTLTHVTSNIIEFDHADRHQSTAKLWCLLGVPRPIAGITRHGPVIQMMDGFNFTTCAQMFFWIASFVSIYHRVVISCEYKTWHALSTMPQG